MWEARRGKLRELWLRASRTVILVGHDELIPLLQERASAVASCALPELGLGDLGALDGGLEVLEGAVGDPSEDGGSGGLWNMAVSSLAAQRRGRVGDEPKTSNLFSLATHLPSMKAS